MIRDWVSNEINKHASGVWTLANNRQIKYSDGPASERYLDKVLNKCSDLSSDSYELSGYIKDWASEYHLTRLRANLLKGFAFNRNSAVLEVGCGCGAITRYLGETFDTVIGIEGNLNRARLARLRTKDLQNVGIVCGPFQDIKFNKPFDLIFCIGVFEYSNKFVETDDPYDEILGYFRKYLKQDGTLVLAIENQFGLKYFSSSTEDHTLVMFDGIEGYPRHKNNARTFGYNELHDRLKKHFSKSEFYFPYPDYKVPECIISKRFYKKASVGELAGNFPSRDYIKHQKHLFEEKLALLELDKNDKLHFFSNSFLVFSSNSDPLPVNLGCLGILYSKQRVRELQSVTRFIENKDGSIRVVKTPENKNIAPTRGSLTFCHSETLWVDGLSLHMQLLLRIKEHEFNAEQVFKPCRVWFEYLRSFGEIRGDEVLLDGTYIDHTWKNLISDGDELHFFDKEWKWDKEINIKAITIRSILLFLDDAYRMSGIDTFFSDTSTRRVVKNIAQSFGVQLTNKDFREFYEVDSRFQNAVFGSSVRINRMNCKLLLWNRTVFNALGGLLTWFRKISGLCEKALIRFTK